MSLQPERPSAGPSAPSRPRALIFDLDGTLIDSVGDLHACVNRLLAARGLPALSVAQVRSMVGDGARTLLERALRASGGDLSPASLDAAQQAFSADYLGRPAEHTEVYPGVVDTLEALHMAGFALAVCTNKPHDISCAVLEALGIAPFFSAVIGGDSTPARKPHPQPLQAVLAALGVSAHEALMVGDGAHDALAAAAAGTAFIGVDYGYGTEGFATLTPAPYCISDFSELLELL